MAQKYDQYADAYNALLDGRGDAFSTDNTEVLAWAKESPGFTVGIDALGNEDFFHAEYEKTLSPVYGDDVDPDTLVVEGGKVE